MFAGLMRYISKGYSFVICTEDADPNYMEIAIYTRKGEVAVLRIVSSAVITCGDDAIMNEIERRITEYEHGGFNQQTGFVRVRTKSKRQERYSK